MWLHNEVSENERIASRGISGSNTIKLSPGVNVQELCHRGFPGFLGPGGKVETTESFSEGAVREVFEETGLSIKAEDLIYKGVDEYTVPKTNFRGMVFNYMTQKYSGELLSNPPEGDLVWVDINEALQLPMQPWFKRRFPLFFEPGTFEISMLWDEDNQCALEDKLRKLG